MSRNIIYTNDSRSTIYPSSQVDSTLPNYITENYHLFVTFMERAAESEERLGFGQNLLQNLQKWRDFDTYQDGVIEAGILAADLAIDEIEECELESTYGFPTLNGVILINDEVINYREVKGNKLIGLERGCATTTVLPTFTTTGTYTDSVPAAHLKNSEVKNISVLFLLAMGQSISDSFSNNISFKRISSEVDKSILLENLKDFYQSKGSKLGIKALFKMFFAENDVDVSYPGDRMIKPSSSSYYERQVLRTIPVPDIFCEPFENNVTPEGILGSELVLKSYLAKDIEYAKTFVNYVATQSYESEIQYEIYVDDDFLTGDFVSNPQTTLTRALNDLGTTDTDLRDIFTVTVETTLGFPDKGILFIENEAITYTSKTANQFLNCKRGDIGVFVEHPIGAKVYGPYYVEAKYQKDGITYVSRSWPLGLVQSLDVKDEGLLHTELDEIYINGPGRIDPRDKILTSFVENYDDDLATQAEAAPAIKYIGNFTAGVSGVYFDDKNVYVTSSNLPYATLGPFSNNGTAGSELEGDNAIHVIPRRDEIKPNPFKDKGTNAIGVFADGVTAISNVSQERVYQGIITEVVILDKGNGYITPTLVVDDAKVEDTTFTLGSNGEITSIVTESTQEWVGDKVSTTRVSAGENAVVTLTFDNYGRILTATLDDAGRFYHDLPSIQIIDSSDRGKGGVLSCTHDKTAGTITSVKILNSGIDYNPSTTYVEFVPQGEAVKAEAIVQYYQFNKPGVINYSDELFFDSNNGFTYVDESGALSQYAYYGYPADLKTRLNDDGSAHSPILGWAYDGNPIYGPEVWKNKKNASGGITEARSGYYLRSSRVGELAGGGKTATNPPPESLYPMGTFVEDYSYDPTRVSATELLSTSNITSPPAAAPPNDALLETDPDLDNILVFQGTLADLSICNELNMIKANTPEYPEELYPDGIWFYVATVAGTTPKFPYIMGPNFYNRPISQNVRAIDTISPTHAHAHALEHESYTPSVSYEKTLIDFDFNKVARFRNRYLQSTRDNLRVRVETVKEGTISGVSVINGLPDNSEIGDKLWFDNTGTGGDGAIGEVSMVEGKPVTRGYGQNIGTTLISHRQLIDIDYFRYSEITNNFYKPDYVFVPTTQIETTSGSIATVEEYRYDTRQLIVQTTTARLIQPGDVFFDNNQNLVVARPKEALTFMGTTNVADAAPSSPQAGQFYVNTVAGTASNSWTGIEGEPVAKNQFVYYTTEWKLADVVTTFDGDFEDTSDFESVMQGYRAYLLFETGESMLEELQGYILETEEGKRVINTRSKAGSNYFISYDEPDEAQQGDLWWSINNGRLFVFYEYAYLNPDTSEVTLMKQWVVTQPIGTQTLVGASDTPVVDTPSSVPTNVVHEMKDNSIFISTISPTSKPDGSSLELGDLWWSNETGILYTWITNTSYVLNSDQLIVSEWVSTDPSAIAPMTGASDTSNPTIASENAQTLGEGFFDYTFSPSVTCIISPQPPTIQPDGTDIEDGVLWWSPLTGRMYIRYTDEDSVQWAVTNPIGSIPTRYAMDSILQGGVTIDDGFVRQIPELPSTDLLWFESLKNFQSGDEVIFESSAPGTDRDTGVIVDILPGNGAVIKRSANPGVLINGCPTFVTSRFLFVVSCTEPTMMQPGDIIKLIPNALVPTIDTTDIDEYQVIQEVGTAVAPVGFPVIGTDPSVPSEYGEVIGIQFESLGSGYKRPFYIYFPGGGGTGALGYANVDPVTGSIVLDSSTDPRFPNGNITMVNAGRGYTSLPVPIFGTELSANEFLLFSSTLFPVITGFSYCTSRKGLQGKICKVDMKSHGIQYSTMPKILGSYKKEIDQATYTIFMEGSTIDRVEIFNKGARYVAPTAVFYDLVYPGGSGAQANVTVDNGEIVDVSMIDKGTGYIQPRVAFVEESGKFIPLTNDIGKIKSMKVVDPGRNISPDASLKPEILIDTKCIVEYDATSAGVFVVGEPVYQGLSTDKLFTAAVKEYDNDTQILTLTFNPGNTLSNYGGVLKAGESLIGEQSGAIATVVREGQADTPCVVDGISSPDGFFVTDESMLSRKFAVIQDSYYFSPFSYEISSPMQKSDYETIVRDTTHPVGFALFSNVKINEYQQSGSFVSDINPVTINT